MNSENDPLGTVAFGQGETVRVGPTLKNMANLERFRKNFTTMEIRADMNAISD